MTTSVPVQETIAGELAVCLAECSGPPPRIGIAGVGGVAAFAHVPAYRKLGFSVDVLYDTSSTAIDTCRRNLDENHSAVTATHLDDLWDHLPGLDFLDVAVPTPAHATFINTLFDRLGRDCPALLVQKPLAEIGQAEKIVDRAAGLGIRVAVNLTGRWIPPFANLHDMIRDGEAGGSNTVTVLNRGWNPKNGTDWRSQLSRLIAFEMAVHHIDFLIWAYGVPRTAYAAMQHVPGLGVQGENAAFMTFAFEDGTKASIIEDWTCRDAAVSHFHPTHEQITVSGDQATVVATPHELRVTDHQLRTRIHTSSAPWFPDAFAGPPAEFVQALRQNRPSPLDAANHLRILRVLEACYMSADTNTVVEVKQ